MFFKIFLNYFLFLQKIHGYLQISLYNKKIYKYPLDGYQTHDKYLSDETYKVPICAPPIIISMHNLIYTF